MRVGITLCIPSTPSTIDGIDDVQTPAALSLTGVYYALHTNEKVQFRWQKGLYEGLCIANLTDTQVKSTLPENCVKTTENCRPPPPSCSLDRLQFADISGAHKKHNNKSDAATSGHKSAQACPKAYMQISITRRFAQG